MGKKPQKTKEVSVAIAEASSTVDEAGQQLPQATATRKRGRPRKIIVKMESEGEKAAQGTTESSMEKGTVNKEEEQHEVEGASSVACTTITEQQQEMQLPKGEPSRSRARRKSKPRKST
ncbi:hypothetical protein SESBI_39145 [Sesbania bispinosa]|nr:hypothetical protein SESBI_39145 [Sesbania bispinosa]